MTVEKWSQNRTAFMERQRQAVEEGKKANGRHPKSGSAQNQHIEETKVNLIFKYMQLGFKKEEAKAKRYLSGKAALHDPDQIAGGSYNGITRLGSLRINSSLGSQWKNNIPVLDDHMEAYKTTGDEGKMMMSVNLHT